MLFEIILKSSKPISRFQSAITFRIKQFLNERRLRSVQNDRIDHLMQLVDFTCFFCFSTKNMCFHLKNVAFFHNSPKMSFFCSHKHFWSGTNFASYKESHESHFHFCQFFFQRDLKFPSTSELQ